MSIATVVTGGYGDATIGGTPTNVTLWGYSIAVATFTLLRGTVSIVKSLSGTSGISISLSGSTGISPSLSGNVEIE